MQGAGTEGWARLEWGGRGEAETLRRPAGAADWGMFEAHCGVGGLQALCIAGVARLAGRSACLRGARVCGCVRACSSLAPLPTLRSQLLHSSPAVPDEEIQCCHPNKSRGGGGGDSPRPAPPPPHFQLCIAPAPCARRGRGRERRG